MGKWADRLKSPNAWATLPAKPAEGASGGYAGELAVSFRNSAFAEGPSGDLIELMSMSQFAMSGQYRRVSSKVLDEIIILAADNAELPDFGGTVVYRAAEARLLVGLPAVEVRAFHEVKVFFDGIIERATPNEFLIDAKDLLKEDTMS